MNSIYAGLAIGLGCWTYLSVSNKIIGALLFSCGLLAIRLYNLDLFTGKCQYILTFKNSWKYYLKILFGNLFGICIMAGLAGLASKNISIAANEIAILKQEQSFIEALLKGLACGMLMSLATYKQTPLWISSLCVVTFILSGFNHCIADAFYMFAGHIIGFSWLGTLFGNILGGAIFTVIKRDE